ncbi:hypothetical protein CEXT_321231 [Caerostris extrusa]|uniref:Ycf1 n=1 Tax=Caerostris extrusa TaxID=172846 RepID=A0AAV4PZW5_CAEEX|nr:hypothetical protein CEXT_321231 [Caerostris extrusa]
MKLQSLIKTKDETEQLRTSRGDKENDMDILDECLEEMVVRIRILISTGKVSADKNVNLESSKVKVKLPEIQLPEFYETYEAWDLLNCKFNSLIFQENEDDTEKNRISTNFFDFRKVSKRKSATWYRNDFSRCQK